MHHIYNFCISTCLSLSSHFYLIKKLKKMLINKSSNISYLQFNVMIIFVYLYIYQLKSKLHNNINVIATLK